ncbi:TetR family transcriptional regulator [Nocardioides deserti]|uniref:TetR family transcriptional regulator n=1 Tax=Nocardioides deserti TaxID=1588644 RepID=A0ABR6U6V4_9ACTN|nr:TetR family transcriptional regulator [Nocardioides deserti]MBC2960103.1 TetR family transcriptional regulator [Nocardioides deserti]GGO74921.1 putative transcriptional regulator, TetR family protein [Nocardioides deserti]
MPRVAEDRPPAEPTSREQKERYARILRAAARHGAAKGLERVQMHDIAKDAGVAIATLYRYFPSKTHLFTALMRSQVERLAAMTVERVPDESPAEGIARMLVRAGRELLERPLLAHAMMQSNNATVAQTPSAGVTEVFIDLMLDAGGITDPTPHDLRLLGILEQAWYGMIISALNRGTDPRELEEDTALVVSLVVGAREAGSRTGDAA